MLQYDETQIYPVGPNMLSYKNELFSVHFPKHLYDSVLNCSNCLYSGMWNGCIIMQCMNCCSEIDNPSVYGAYTPGVEINKEHPNSPSNTYLKGVDLDTVGDKYLNDSKNTMKEPIIEEIKVMNQIYRIDRKIFPYTVSKINYTEANNYDGHTNHFKNYVEYKLPNDLSNDDYQPSHIHDGLFNKKIQYVSSDDDWFNKDNVKIVSFKKHISFESEEEIIKNLLKTNNEKIDEHLNKESVEESNDENEYDYYSHYSRRNHNSTINEKKQFLKSILKKSNNEEDPISTIEEDNPLKEIMNWNNTDELYEKMDKYLNKESAEESDDENEYDYYSHYSRRNHNSKINEKTQFL